MSFRDWKQSTIKLNMWARFIIPCPVSSDSLVLHCRSLFSYTIQNWLKKQTSLALGAAFSFSVKTFSYKNIYCSAPVALNRNSQLCDIDLHANRPRQSIFRCHSWSNVSCFESSSGLNDVQIVVQFIAVFCASHGQLWAIQKCLIVSIVPFALSSVWTLERPKRLWKMSNKEKTSRNKYFPSFSMENLWKT